MLWVFLVLSAVVGPACVRAEGSPPIRVGYSEFPPYVFTPPGAAPQGYAVDILTRIAADRGYTLSFVRTANPAETLDLLRTGEIDVTTFLGRSPEREAVGDFTEPVTSLDIRLFVMKRSDIESAADLGGKRVGIVAGSNALQDAQRVAATGTLVEVRTLPELVIALVMGTVDAAVIPEGPFRALLRRAELSERVRTVGEPLRVQALSFLVAGDRADLRADLDAGIARLTGSDDLEAMEQRWFGREKAFLERTNVRIILAAAAFVILALLVGGGIAWRATGRARRNLAEVTAKRLLMEAANVDLVVVIWDDNLRPLHWNDAVGAHFGTIVPLLKAGATFREIVEHNHREGWVVTDELEDEDVAAFARSLEEDLLAGRTEPRFIRLADGSFFEANDFRIGRNMYASVRKDVTRLEAAARHERERIEALFENAAVGLARVDFDGTIVEANGKLASILGTTEAALSGAEFAALVTDADRTAIGEHIRAVVDDRDAESDTEIRMISGSGQTRWMQVTLSKVLPTAHQPGYLIVCAQDVTERHKNEEQRTLLLGELSHRVKNILAVVQTITMQTLRSVKATAEAREKVFVRLRALAAAHDIVFRSNDRDISAVLEAQLAPFQDVGATRIVTSGPGVALPVDQVYALGLIVHELITNAVKYGALSSETGTIDVRWTLDGALLTIWWRETGGPPVTPPEKAGFGSSLIQQMVGHARGGSVEFDFRPEGLVVEIHVSLEE